MKKLLFETDWLASTPVFYNEKTGKASHSINEVIDWSDLEFDPEGFNSFLDFGYSVLGQTPLEHVKFLRHSSRLFQEESGTLSVEYLDDPVEPWLERTCSEEEALDLLRGKVRTWERSCTGEIIVPTSGGYDSRLLNMLVEDKSRVRSFSYGISRIQNQSSEVVYAKRLSEILGTRWEQIPIGDFHLYFEEWDRLFGVSSHAHGMYHIEFFQKISERVLGGNPFLSGVIGDAWAGSVTVSAIDSPRDVRQLGYNHGINADPSASQLSADGLRIEEYFVSHRERLRDSRFRVIEAMRFKIILLCYLMIVPRSFGFMPWSPFLDIEVAMSMLNLPPERRHNRQWQRDFFHARGVETESMGLNANHTNMLDLCALRCRPVQPLREPLLCELIKPDYIQWINRNLHYSFTDSLLDDLLNVRKVGGTLRRLGFSKPGEETLKAYFAYLVLKPIERALQRRESGR